jgi:hypothetical protein
MMQLVVILIVKVMIIIRMPSSIVITRVVRSVFIVARQGCFIKLPGLNLGYAIPIRTIIRVLSLVAEFVPALAAPFARTLIIVVTIAHR